LDFKKYAFKAKGKNSRKKLSLLAGKCFLVNDIALLKEAKKVGKKLSLLAGKLSLGKKFCAFEWCLLLSQKYITSFGGKNLALCNRFDPSKSKCMFDFWLDSVQEYRIFFLFGNPA